MEKKNDKGSNTRYHIEFHSVRKRLADIDNLSGKAVLDAVVRAGILPDDSPKYVKSITHTQEKGDKNESTTIKIFKVKEMEDGRTVD